MGNHAEWFAARTHLHLLLRTQPTWTTGDFAAALKRSVSWVKKWRKRISQAPDDEQVLLSQSRARIHPPPKLDPLVIERVLAIIHLNWAVGSGFVSPKRLASDGTNTS